MMRKVNLDFGLERAVAGTDPNLKDRLVVHFVDHLKTVDPG